MYGIFLECVFYFRKINIEVSVCKKKIVYLIFGVFEDMKISIKYF